LLVGSDLAQRANLHEKFITNNERYQKMCELLQAKEGTPSERLLSLEAIVRALERYRFVASYTDIGVLLAASSLACGMLAACDQSLPQDVAPALTQCASSKRGDGELQRLAAVESLNIAFRKMELPVMSAEREWSATSLTSYG
jgi:hypothetical protein